MDVKICFVLLAYLQGANAGLFGRDGDGCTYWMGVENSCNAYNLARIPSSDAECVDDPSQMELPVICPKGSVSGNAGLCTDFNTVCNASCHISGCGKDAYLTAQNTPPVSNGKCKRLSKDGSWQCIEWELAQQPLGILISTPYAISLCPSGETNYCFKMNYRRRGDPGVSYALKTQVSICLEDNAVLEESDIHDIHDSTLCANKVDLKDQGIGNCWKTATIPITGPFMCATHNPQIYIEIVKGVDHFDIDNVNLEQTGDDECEESYVTIDQPEFRETIIP